MIEIEPVISNQAAYDAHYEVDGPIWPEGCGHAGYVGTVWPITWFYDAEGKRQIRREILDVYIFDSKAYGQEVCLRCGSEGSEYISPGGLMEVIQRNQRPEVIKLILSKGAFKWTKA